MSANVLVVDDDDDLRGTVVEILRELKGWAVHEARDGHEALELIAAGGFDAIVLDHRMPGLTGAEVVRHLRLRETTVPVILVTAARDVQVLAAELGVDCFLGKPFGVDDLIALVDRAVAGKC